ncbi:MAG: aconitate hydratase AcnA [Candidatus Omnitrophica bacterium CG11_big_fil_rev_8_21_14_0_20_45_26]|uniref:Aconitate hydratase n=1 Tax=Candidatus Abzuiibacterium crystallinum TaxID=1974748 RepID=A0A2H0LL30_9BACT|nr:MAG: aconitate hydratase AcnA [Candidatus Omnitrophica bacterium CG11_big_fil_rev_8_21_14_0_20_45_26]PIW64009.1 MAG: aconitate hydratase AcnA [Candidatus Omnitrophica bacterium CG12_big_fil_rev_8_21_14_0_65_45_16]
MQDSFKTKTKLTVASQEYVYYSLTALQKTSQCDLSRLPFSTRILLENLIRTEDGHLVKRTDIEKLLHWDPHGKVESEIAFTPARVLLQDFTGVPAVVDLAAMRDAIREMGGDPAVINPLQPADLVIDHSVQVDTFGTKESFNQNTKIEFERNQERYQFLKWGQRAFKNFSVVPPGTGIVHQVNLEYLASVVFEKDDRGEKLLYPDTLVGTDSHTTMINGLGVLGWGVGGIEAEAAMLGQPISMLIPEVVGFKLIGKLREGVTATDLVLTVTQMLRQKGVVGKFVEFFGPGLDALTLPDRATLANMAPEYGATAGYFPIDQVTIDFLRLSGRDADMVACVEAYAKAQGLFRTSKTKDPEYSDRLELDLVSVEASLAGPKRPQDRVALKQVGESFQKAFSSMMKKDADQPGKTSSLEHGAVVISAITSCTNTSNPAVMIAAGLLAKKAVERGLNVKPWVKTSLAPGSKVVMDYLKAAKLLEPLEKLKFNLVGFGCTTCIGNSGPLPEPVASEVKERDLVAAAVLSGNRNFEGRVNPLVRANYLASPPLVVAYALAGNVNIDLSSKPIGQDQGGRDVFLRDIWPSQKEIQEAMKSVTADMFKQQYGHVFEGDESWRQIQVPSGDTFGWDEHSTYIKKPPFLQAVPKKPAPLSNIQNARTLVMVGDSVTTDHISPAGSIAADSPAGEYLIARGVQPKAFNSYGARRGNFEVMARGTFANIRLKNMLASGTEGCWTKYLPDGKVMSIYEAAMKYIDADIPLLVMAGKEYGTGSSRDWAAKGPALLGIKVVLAESFERIHRSNLIGMGILPLQFQTGESRESLGLKGDEVFDFTGIAEGLSPKKKITVAAKGAQSKKTFSCVCRLDTPAEISYYEHGGILQFVLRQLSNQ